jgi:glycosyl transferase family 25
MPQSVNAIYINLDRREDRRTQFEADCQRMDLTVERFSAITHTVPAIGATRSHLEVLKLARARGYPAVIVFEDDIEFFMTRPEMDAMLAALPEDYDVVMLDYYLNASTPYNDLVVRVTDAQSASCYLVHSRFYDRLIANLEEAVQLYEANPHCHWLYIVDQYWKRLQPVSNWYALRSRLGRQRPGYSDLKQEFLANEY